MAILQLHTFVLVFYSLRVQYKMSAFRSVHLLRSEVGRAKVINSGKNLQIHATFFFLVKTTLLIKVNNTLFGIDSEVSHSYETWSG